MRNREQSPCYTDRRKEVTEAGGRGGKRIYVTGTVQFHEFFKLVEWLQPCNWLILLSTEAPRKCICIPCNFWTALFWAVSALQCQMDASKQENNGLLNPCQNCIEICRKWSSVGEASEPGQRKCSWDVTRKLSANGGTYNFWHFGQNDWQSGVRDKGKSNLRLKVTHVYDRGIVL